MILSTPAVVLRCVDYSESSRIVTLSTRDAGKVSVMARGCRNPKSKLAALMEPGNVLDVVVHIKAGRDVHTLSEASFRAPTWGIRQDLTRLAVTLSLLELVEPLLSEGEGDPEFHEFLEQVFRWFHQPADDLSPAHVFPYLQVRIAALLGIGLSVEGEPRFLDVEGGSVGPESGMGLSFLLTPAQGEYLVVALGSRSSRLFKAGMPYGELVRLVRHLDVYLQHHTGTRRERRSDSLWMTP